MSHLVELTWDRTKEGQMTRKVRMGAIPAANTDTIIAYGDQSFQIRSIAIVANPAKGTPEAYIRLVGSV